MYNILLLYYDTICTSRVRKLNPRVIPDKFRKVVIPACHVSVIAGHRHEQKITFRIMAHFWCPMFNT